MRIRNYLAALLLFFGPIGSSSAFSQARPAAPQAALARADVLTRAALFERTITEAARKEGVDPKILWTIAYNETRFRPWLTSPKHAKGLMQFMPATAARFGLKDPYEPNSSIHAAARYVKYLGELFGWSIDSVLAAYNSGEGTVSAYLSGRPIRSNGKLINAAGRRTAAGIPPYRETMNYVSQGLKIYRWLETQGRFGTTRNAHEIFAMGPGRSPEQAAPAGGDEGMASTTVVLYEPRTGRRELSHTSKHGDVGAILANGPVIISPDTRTVAAQKARSTFAGGNRP